MENFNKSIESLNGISTSISQEILQFYKHSIEIKEEICDCGVILSEDSKSFLITNIKNQPYETIQIVQEVQKSYKMKHKTDDSEIFSSALTYYLTILSNDEEIDSNIIYSLLSCQETDLLSDDVLTNLHESMVSERLNVAHIYLALLSRSNLNLLYQVLNYKKKYYTTIDINDHSALFNYCIDSKCHWLSYFLKNDITFALSKFAISNKLWFLKLLFISNNKKFILQDLEKCITQCISKNISDNFAKYYIVEIKRVLAFYKECTKVKEVSLDNFILIATAQSCLETLYNVLDVNEIELGNQIKTILSINEKYVCEQNDLKKIKTDNLQYSETDTYNVYNLLLLTEKYIEISTKDITTPDLLQILLNNSKNVILQSTNIKYQIDTFEKVFALIFIKINKRKDVINVIRKSVQYIATLIKSSLKEIKSKHFAGVNKKSENYIKLNSLIKYVTDFIWRLDLLKCQHVQESVSNIDIMTSTPSTLVQICLENDDFGKAHEVIEVFNIRDRRLENKIDFMEKYQYMCSKTITTGDPETQIDSIINFYKENSHLEKDSESIEQFEELKHLKDNELYMNLIDSAITLSKDHQGAVKLISEANKYKKSTDNHSDYEKFCENIIHIFKSLNENTTISNILINSDYSLNYNKFREKEQFYSNLSRCLQAFYKETNQEELYQELSEMLTSQNFLSENNLKKVYNYLSQLAQLLLYKENIFQILSQNRAAMIGELFFVQKIPPRELESLFNKLELDIVYHIAWNCLPVIKLKKKENISNNYIVEKYKFNEYIKMLKEKYCSEDKMNQIYTPDFSLLSYIRKRNWLLAYIINKTHKIEEAKPDTNSDRTKFFNNLLTLRRNKILQTLFGNNLLITSLQSEINLELFIKYLEKQEIKDWRSLYNIIDNYPENSMMANKDILMLKDHIICNFVSDATTTSDEYLYVQRINDSNLRIQCILDNLKNWPGKICIDVLENELTHNESNSEVRTELEDWYHRIKLYECLTFHWKEMDSWYDVFLQSTQNPKLVFQWLLTTIDPSNILQWLKIHNTFISNIYNLFEENYLLKFLNDTVDLNVIKHILDLLPFDHRIHLCKNSLKQVRKLESINFLIVYLTTLLPETEPDYRNIKLSLKIMSCFHPNEHQHMWCLINKPLLIIEQLIMNTRLEKLSQVLEVVKDDNYSAYDISIENIDNLIRTYAEKSLAFRGIQPNVQKKNMEFKLLQSLDTLSDDTNESHKKAFTMPDNVPTKEEWIKNEKASECMCCQTVTFSMFNRRHHCRRCGRVVCGNCSTKKMELPAYGNITVRVCDDCFKQSDETRTSSIRSEYNSSRSGSLTCWILTDDDKHNEIAREEFSYEYAPSVSLCLSILKLHSESIEYPKFLLQLCKKLLPNLQETIKEIDYSFLIQMLKSLATAAKMICLNLNFKIELSLCNNMLLQIELLGLLADRGCSEVLSFYQGINKKYKQPDDPDDYYMNSAMLRRLNEKLMELEQWNVALEVATKAGLDNTTVFASWGMSCLKAGALQLAREKFHHCLEKNIYYDTSSDLNTSINMSIVSENRPTNTPPLVNEIVSVLESKSYNVYKNIIKDVDVVELNASTLSLSSACGSVSYDPAICVINKLKNLKNVIEGKNVEKFEINFKSKSDIYLEPRFYDECLYYLSRYGSHLSILRFYLRHEDFREALSYILENRLQVEIFIDVYMTCVQDGMIDEFHNQMRDIDPNLYIWEVYLRSICGYLEKKQMFHILYNIQIFMCDYVRAAMTCIKFYKEDATNFTELLDREHYLHEAQNHLKHELEQEQWVKVTTVPDRKLSSASSDSSSMPDKGFAMKINPRNIDKHINTIWRQIEIVKFLAECEMENRSTMAVLESTFKIDCEGKSQPAKRSVPTLFDTNYEKIQLTVLAVLCGKNIEDGFGIAFRIIQDYHLKYLKVYCICGKYITQKTNEAGILELISCIRSSGLSEDAVNEACDEVLTMCIHTLMEINAPGTQREKLIKLITDPGAKINAYIECKQLKCAYLLAVQHNRNHDIRKILREADRLNQPQIKAICIKRLSQMQ